MIFTIGHRDSYLDAIRRGATKLGPTNRFPKHPYPGGVAFLSAAEAKAHLDLTGMSWEWGVFALEGEPEDTYQYSPEELRIIRDLKILHEVKEFGGART